jgi:hypothetical protein
MVVSNTPTHITHHGEFPPQGHTFIDVYNTQASLDVLLLFEHMVVDTCW